MTLAAAAAAGAGAPTALAASPDDQSILRLNLQLEQVVALAYQLALSSGRLDRRHRATATDILAHERAHEQALATYLRDLGASLPAPPTGIAAVDAVVPGLGAARSQADLLGVLAELEAVSIRGYYLGIQRIYDQKLVETATAILGAEAQHLTVLRASLGRDPVPAAFEVGASVR